MINFASSEGVIAPYNATNNSSMVYNDTGQGHDEDHGGGHGVHVIAWNLEYVAEPLIVSIFILSAGLLKLGFHYASFLSSIIPESCLLIVTGTIFGAILNAAGMVDKFQMHPRLFMLFLLPPIVLDSAYSLNDRVFFEHLGTILVYAVIGTIINFAMLGPTLYGLATSGAMGPLDISLSECLLFASFIVAVDPVAVLAIFQEVGVNNTLYFLVFGESLLNDAVTVVLSNMMKAFVDMETIPYHQVLIGVASFFTVSLGGLFIGLVYGILTAIFTKHTSHVRVVEPLAVLILAYLSYLTAELVHWSGIIAMIACGLVQAEYSFHNISRKSYTTVKYFIKMISSSNDCIIFLFLGIELVTTDHQWHTGFVLWSMFYCLVFRFLVVFGLTFILNRANLHKINFEEQFIMWYGGLRGAVCFALCDTIRDDFRHKNMFLTTTFFVILTTVFAMGSTIKPLVSLCRIKKKGEEAEIIFEELHSKVNDHFMTGIETIIEHSGSNHLRTRWIMFNERYLMHWFQRDPMREDEKILACYGKMVMKDYEDQINKAYLHPSPTQENLAKFYDDQSSTPISPMYKKPTDQVTPKYHVRTPTANGEAEPKSPKLRHRSLNRQDSRMEKMAHALSDAIHRRRSINLDEPTVADVKVLLKHSGLSTSMMHQKYDKNLIFDDDSDIERHLEEKRRRLERMRRMTLRQMSMAGSPQAARRHSSAHLPGIPEVPSRRRLVSETDVLAPTNSSSNLQANPTEPDTEHVTIVAETEETLATKPQTKFYLSKDGKSKEGSVDRSQRMKLLHDQDTIQDTGESDRESTL